MGIIALTGQAGAGKDTVARILGGKIIPFAEPIKKFCQEVFDFSDAQIWGPSEERNRPDFRYPRGSEIELYLTPRYALQTLGTEWGRNCYQDIWADLGVRRALAHLSANPGSTVVIPDCRFTNEARAVKAAGGQIWRIVRPVANGGGGLDGLPGAHASEQEQNSPEFSELVSYTLYNGGSLANLVDEVHWIVGWPESI